MSEKTSTVSVIIPTYNRAHLIRKAIQSVLNQTYRNFEVIIVDDGSTDNTAKVVESFKDKRIKYLRHEKNQGAPAARNTGIEIAKGQYIGFLDSDDEWLPGKLEKSLREFQISPPEVGLVYSNFWLVRDAKNRKPFLNEGGPEGRISRALLRKSYIQMGAALIKTSCLGNIRFDEELPKGQDRDFFIRICKQCDAVYIDEPLLIWYADDMRNRISTGSKISSKLATRNAIYLRKYKEDLEDMPKIYNRYLFSLGRYLILNNEVKKGRGYLFTGIKEWPFNLKLWLTLFFSYVNIDLLKILDKAYKIVRKKLRTSNRIFSNIRGFR